ncbi:hypothetical protein PVAG01_00497 [Phlyctema vagabunda]|uniref:DUF676 domain-containing protein n=1 Tax=Phlyctema vagabunda TaxID=108571 RepID=A0ABR4PUE9_9HELO
MAAVPPKKHSKFDKQEVTQGLNVLYTPPEFVKNPAACIDIIAVPGLGSDMTRTWMSQNVHWLKDESMLQKVVPEARISVFGYRSQWYGPDAVQNSISSIANYLLRQIHLERHGKNSKRPIIFLGHSLGGLVVAKAVSEAKRRPEDFPGLFTCITSCVFLGTPFRGSDAQPFARLIGMAGDTIGLAQYNDLLRSLKAGSVELDDLANDFLGDARKASVELICYYETENTMAKPDWEVGKLFKTGVVIASKKSSTFEGYPNFPWARTHSQMNKFEGPKDIQYKDVSGTLKELFLKAFKLMKSRQDSVRQDFLNDSRTERILESLEVLNLKKDLNAIKSVQGTSPSWILEDTKYRAWKEANEHHNFWISGSPGMGKTKAAVSMVDDLDQLTNADRNRDDSPVFAYFFCDEQDRNKSKAINVLKTLVWQLLRAKRFLIRHFFTEENRSKPGQKAGSQSFDFNSLPFLWNCLQSALVDPSLGTVYFLVSGLDQIDSESRKEFLGLFASWKPPVLYDEDGSAPVVKWLFLSVSRQDIQIALRESVKINLDDGSNSTKQNDALRKLVAERINEVSSRKGYSRSLEYYTKSYICFRAEGKSNLDWVNLVCLELEYDQSNYSTIRQHLESLPSDLGPMYDQLSRRVLSLPGLDVECSKEILRSLLLVYQPPTLYELAIIADLPEKERDNEEAILKHVRRCGAFTQITNDEGKLKVQLSYNSVRDYLKSKADDWLSMPSEQIQHGIIALRCFEYVRAAVQKAHVKNVDENEDEKDTDEENSDSGEKDETVVLEPAEPNKEQEEQILMPLIYPYTKWIEHALEATPDIVESFGLEEVFWLLGSEERAEWSKSYQDLNSESDFDVKFTALHIAAYFGYVPLANLLLRDEAHRVELSMLDSNDHQPLFWACKRGRMNMVQKLCEEGANLNGAAEDGIASFTPLHGAASSGSIEVVEYLIDHGAIIDVLNESHGTPLYIAVEEESLPIVKLLLDKGADPNSEGGEEDVPLNAAADIGSLETVKLLLSRGAELNPERQYDLGNAVGVASYQGHSEVVKYLLEQGCRFDIADSDGMYPLSLAAEEGYPECLEIILEHDRDPLSHDQALGYAVEHDQLECVKLLVEKCPALERKKGFAYAANNGFSDVLKVLGNKGISREELNDALYEAADYQHVDTVGVLLEMGADPNSEGQEFGNALQAAAYDGNEDMLKVLLDHNADPNRVYGDHTYGTALQAAAFQGSIVNVELLVERGALINEPACGRYGNALHAACSANRLDVVKFLLAQGADPNARGGELSYPIIAAANYGHMEIIELLLEHNAEVNVSGGDGNGSTLVHAAFELPRSTLELICDRGADIHYMDDDGDTAFTMAAASGDTDSVRFLIEKGSNIQVIGKWGGALYRATENGNCDCMKALLESGVNVNQEGGDEHTALQCASSCGNVEGVKLLLDHGADVNIIGGTFQTALQAAASAEELEIVELLLEKGAHVNVQGGRHGTALHAAVGRDSQELVDALVSHGANINAVDEVRGSVISWTALKAYTPVLESLIASGGDVNLRGGKYDNVLQVACYTESEDEVKMLLEHGVDPSYEGGYYGSAIGAAAAMGNLELINILLGHEKKPTPLMLSEALYNAVHFRRADAVKLFLEHGVDVESKSKRYDSVLEALETPLSTAEIAQNGYKGDEYDEDDDDDDDEDEDQDEEEEEEDEDDDEDDTNSEGSEEDIDVNAAQDIENYEGIKQMLTEALENAKRARPIEPQVSKPSSDMSGYIPHIQTHDGDNRSSSQGFSNQTPWSQLSQSDLPSALRFSGGKLNDQFSSRYEEIKERFGDGSVGSTDNYKPNRPMSVQQTEFRPDPPPRPQRYSMQQSETLPDIPPKPQRYSIPRKELVGSQSSPGIGTGAQASMRYSIPSALQVGRRRLPGDLSPPIDPSPPQIATSDYRNSNQRPDVTQAPRPDQQWHQPPETQQFTGYNRPSQPDYFGSDYNVSSATGNGSASASSSPLNLSMNRLQGFVQRPVSSQQIDEATSGLKNKWKKFMS